MPRRKSKRGSVAFAFVLTVGILSLLALRELTQAGRVLVVAKHPRQRELALASGATDVIAPREAVGVLRRVYGDAVVRQLFIMALFAGVAGAFIALA